MLGNPCRYTTAAENFRPSNAWLNGCGASMHWQSWNNVLKWINYGDYFFFQSFVCSTWMHKLKKKKIPARSEDLIFCQPDTWSAPDTTGCMKQHLPFCNTINCCQRVRMRYVMGRASFYTWFFMHVYQRYLRRRLALVWTRNLVINVVPFEGTWHVKKLRIRCCLLQFLDNFFFFTGALAGFGCE